MRDSQSVAFRKFMEKITAPNLLHEYPLDLVSSFFQGESATLWLHDINTKEEFVLVNSHNRPDLSGRHGELSFLLSESILYGIMQHSSAKCYLELDLLHKSLSEWRKDASRQYVIEKYKKLLFIPLRSSLGNIIAYVVLYSNHFLFSDNAQNDILHFQKICGNVLHSLINENERLLRERRKIGHEIARQLANAGKQVDKFVSVIEEQKSMKSSEAIRFLDDLKGGLRSARDTAGNETFREGVLKRVPTSSFINLRDQFNSSAHLALSEFPRRRVAFSPATSIPPELQIKIHRVDLDLLVSNLVSNSAKYSTPGGTIRTRWNLQTDGYDLSVSNTSEPLSSEELETLTRFGIRGSNAKGVEGDGVGLAIVNDICGAYGMLFTISQTDGKVPWIVTKITIPKSMVRE